ncbi:UNVERIFIED_CONTAM: hypothetical protein Slati_2147500 [Sesamum latifolium]|uniref:Reverse transcriptase domain-containing protein n=1 Tax=Sesamum latifolium TaxID=2727402 RepID=A0AAW2WRW2_9LAMI
MEDAPLIQFGRAERSGPQTMHNDALVIIAILANYEVGRIFIDSGSSADILFRRSRASSRHGLPPSDDGERTARKTCCDLHLPHEDQVSYPRRNRRSTRRPSSIQKVLRGRCPRREEGRRYTQDKAPPNKKGKAPEEKISEATETPAKVQPAEELLNIQIIPGDPNKTTRISSHLGEEAKKEITLCLQRNADIFAWTPQDLEGIDPQVITHHLNIDPNCKPVKQKKRHFWPEKDKIIQQK